MKFGKMMSLGLAMSDFAASDYVNGETLKTMAYVARQLDEEK
ncbi:hypothetical protein [Bifidobacterium callimiconis]|uniref:Uncharacterized protein n=1 Tax=Bifidobacterium callimiconis TaxID=2306973 RepID=A0A430F9E4_9BIFI|nr:hypothetical protein [Bifidobacterium callimiconis]RSX49455.1 hypothetical protein D2E23_2043 [Bifidobacterium callimiconis]